MSKRDNPNCLFCGKSKSESLILISGIDGQICDLCSLKAFEIVITEPSIVEDNAKKNAIIKNVTNTLISHLKGDIAFRFISNYVVKSATEVEKEELLKNLITPQEIHNYLQKTVSQEDKTLFVFKNEIRSLVKENHIKEALEKMFDYTLESKAKHRLRDEIIMCQSKLRNVSNSLNNGTINYEESLKITSQITVNILRLCDEL